MSRRPSLSAQTSNVKESENRLSAVLLVGAGRVQRMQPMVVFEMKREFDGGDEAEDKKMRIQAPPAQPQIKVEVELWDVVLHPTARGMGGYLTFKCTVEKVGAGKRSGIMGTNATSTLKGEWSLPFASQGVSINMSPENDTYLKKYLQRSLQKGGVHYYHQGQAHNLPHPPLVASLIAAMQLIATFRGRDGQPHNGLKAAVMTILKLDERSAVRARGSYGDMALTGLNWAFAPSEAWRRFSNGMSNEVGNE